MGKFLILLLIVLISCKKAEVVKNGEILELREDFYEPYVIDGCEYFIYQKSLTHKGNCKSCRKWLKDLEK